MFLHCDTAHRGESYRFTVTNAAGGTKLADKLSDEPEAVFAGLPAGANVNITVSTKNAAGESQASAAIAAVVP